MEQITNVVTLSSSVILKPNDNSLEISRYDFTIHYPIHYKNDNFVSNL